MDATEAQPNQPPSRPLPPDDRRCTGKGKDGERCRAWTVRGSNLCRGHSLSTEERTALTEAASRARSERSEARADTVERGRMGLKALMAERLEAEADALVTRLLDIVRNGSDADALRAAETLMSRVHGRPVQPTEDLTPTRLPSTPEEVRAMTPEERRQLLALALPATPEPRSLLG